MHCSISALVEFSETFEIYMSAQKTFVFSSRYTENFWSLLAFGVMGSLRRAFSNAQEQIGFQVPPPEKQVSGTSVRAGLPSFARGILMRVAREPFFKKYCPSWEESNHRLESCQGTRVSNRLGVGLGGEYHFSYYSEVKKVRGDSSDSSVEFVCVVLVLP